MLIKERGGGEFGLSEPTSPHIPQTSTEILCMHGYIYALYICLASMKLPRIHILHIRMLVLCIGWNRDA